MFDVAIDKETVEIGYRVSMTNMERTADVLRRFFESHDRVIESKSSDTPFQLKNTGREKHVKQEYASSVSMCKGRNNVGKVISVTISAGDIDLRIAPKNYIVLSEEDDTLFIDLGPENTRIDKMQRQLDRYWVYVGIDPDDELQ
jgi:hypothetical protein